MNSIKRTGILLMFTMLLATGCATTGEFVANTGEFFADAGITTRVKKAIYSEPELKVMAIHVSTAEGMVRLTGAVKTRAERAKAIQVARKVEGVKGVKSELQVE
jgi:osmotically-inducible protein OsmY